MVTSAFATLLRAGTLLWSYFEKSLKKSWTYFPSYFGYFRNNRILLWLCNWIYAGNWGLSLQSWGLSGPNDHWEDALHLIGACVRLPDGHRSYAASCGIRMKCSFGIRTPLYNITFVLELNDRSRWWIGSFFIDHSIPLAISSTTGTVQSISDKS